VPPLAPGFTIARLIGTGGFGSVWEASNDAGLTVALKVSHAADRNDTLRFKREADALSRVGSPYVPTLYGVGTLADGRPYLVIERLFGRTLADEMEAWGGPPSITTVKMVGSALLESAAAMHLAGVLHRDFKPENVFLTGEDPIRAKWIDFGLSRAQFVARDTQVTLAAGAGTPEYMSPEQLSAGEVDLRSDVYALGVILFEILTLRLPFVGDRLEIEYGHLSLRPPRLSLFATVPSALERVVLRCLAKDPQRRLANAEVLRQAFFSALVDGTVPPHRPPGLVVETSKASLRSGAATSSTETGGSGPRSSERRPRQQASEREKVALLFVQGSPMSAKQIQASVETFGGHLVQTGTGRGVCAFRHRGGDNPGQRALSAAEALLAKDLVARVRIDAGTVAVRMRPDGRPRLLSSLFDEVGRYPNATDPAGLRLTAAGHAILPAIPCQPASDQPDLFVPVAPTEDTGRTPSSTVIQDEAPLIGRANILRGLMNEAEQAIRERRPRVASVLAEPGLGKTRLGIELAHQLRQKISGAKVIELRAREPLENNADETLAELLRRAANLPRSGPADGGRTLLTERLGELGTDGHVGAALALGWISPGDPQVQALRTAPGVLRGGMAKAGRAAVCSLATHCPVIVLVDDAQWADTALLDALEQATVSTLPLWVCALGQPPFAEFRPTWGLRAAHLHVERLGPLGPEDAADLCRYLLLPATNVPQPLIARLVDRAQAIPLLLCDLVNGLRRHGLVRKRAGDVWFVVSEMLDELPDSFVVEWIAARELEELSKDLAGHARLLSLLSHEFTWEEVDGVLTTTEEDIGEAFPLDARVGIERLTESRLLVRHRDGRYGFRNAIAREAVAKTVAGDVRVRVHRTALAYYRGAVLPETARLQRLAWHAAQAGERREAAATYATLAELARERHNDLEAELLYSHALSQLDDADPERRLKILKGRGIARYRLGRHDGSLVDFAEARELAMGVGDRAVQADVMLDESMALDWLLEWRRSRELAEQARDLVAGLHQPALWARAVLAVGRSLHRFNHDEEAAGLLREAAELAVGLGDEGYEVELTAQIMLGFVLPFIGRLDEAEERLARASLLSEAKGDELHLAAVWNNRSCLWIARNDRERFIRDNDRVLAFSRRMGNANLERGASLNAAYYLYWRGEFAAAEPLARRAIEIDEHYFRQGGFRPDGAVLLARILWGEGDPLRARKLVEEVVAQQAAVRDDGKSELLLQPNDEMLLDMIALVVHGGDSAAWDRLVDRARDVAQGQELIEVLEVAGLLALQRGDRQEARRWWAEAIDTTERIPSVMSDRIRERIAQLA
jgi:serine/threonine protein kinase/tetratricopeptide (TPR) repeat protein